LQQYTYCKILHYVLKFLGGQLRCALVQ